MSFMINTRVKYYILEYNFYVQLLTAAQILH